MSDPNPVAGQDCRINMVVRKRSGKSLIIVDLTGAAVTIEYRKPDKVKVIGVTPTLVGTTGGEVQWLIPNTLTTEGNWTVWAKIIDSGDKVSYVNPAVKIHFDSQG